MLLHTKRQVLKIHKKLKKSKADITVKEIEVTSWLVSADDFSSRVARGANERVSAANE